MMLKLMVDRTVVDPTIKIRWCASRGLLGHLQKKEAKNAHLLVVLGRESPYSLGPQIKEESFICAPLEQGMQYIQIPASGDYKLFATIVWGPKWRMKQVKEWVRKRDANLLDVRKRDVKLLDDSGHFTSDIHPLEKAGFTVLSISVPSGMFAKEPPEWEKRWVNLYYDGRQPKDQCAYRRRRIFAYTMQPVFFSIVVVLFVLKSLLMLSILALASIISITAPWKFKPRRILSPHRYETLDVLEVDDPSASLVGRFFDRVMGFLNPFLGEEARESLKPAVDYEDLACDRRNEWSLSKVPLQQRVCLVYQGVKARVCKPFAR